MWPMIARITRAHIDEMAFKVGDKFGPNLAHLLDALRSDFLYSTPSASDLGSPASIIASLEQTECADSIPRIIPTQTTVGTAIPASSTDIG